MITITETIYSKCKNDPIYFIENIIKMPGPKPYLHLMGHQKEMVNLYQTNIKYKLVTGPRCSGLTLVSLAYLLWDGLFNSKHIILTNVTKRAAQMDLDLIKTMYYELPKWLRFTHIKVDNRDKFYINNTKFQVLSVTETSMRGYSPDLVYMDNITFKSPQLSNEFVYQTLISRASIIATSSGKLFDGELANLIYSTDTEMLDIEMLHVAPNDVLSTHNLISDTDQQNNDSKNYDYAMSLLK